MSASPLTSNGGCDSRLLWITPDNKFQVWNLTDGGQNNMISPLFGPVVTDGLLWLPVKVGVGGDGLTRVLLSRSDGFTTLWVLGADLSFGSSFPGYGPFGDARCTDMAVAPNNSIRLLWTRPNRSFGLWTLSPTGVPSYSPAFGPINTAQGAWSASKIGVGANGNVRVLLKSSSSLNAVWTLDGAMNLASSSQGFGDSNWNPVGLALNTATTGDNKRHMLWKRTDNQAVFWRLSPDDSLPIPNALEVNGTFGPYTGWTPQNLSVGGDGLMRALWTHTDGRAAFWKLATDGNSYQVNIYGPLPTAPPTPTATPVPTAVPTPTPVPTATPDPNAPGKQTPIYNTFRPGDLFVGMDQGRVEWRRGNPTPSFQQLLTDPTGKSNFGMSFDSEGNLVVANGASNSISRFSADGVYIPNPAPFLSVPSNPTSVASYSRSKLVNGDVTDFGNTLFFGTGDVVYQSAFPYNTPTALNVTPRSNWVAVDDGAISLFYSSSLNSGFGSVDIVRRYINGVEQSPFRLFSDETANAVAILPGGGALVAAGPHIVQFNSAGMRVCTYDATGPGTGNWTSLTLGAPQEGADFASTFYAASAGSPQVYEFALRIYPSSPSSTGSLLFTASGPVYGLAVKNSATTRGYAAPKVVTIAAVDVAVGSTYYFGGPPDDSFTPTVAGITERNFDDPDGSTRRYIVNAFNPPKTLTCNAYFDGYPNSKTGVDKVLPGQSFKVVVQGPIVVDNGSPVAVYLDSAELFRSDGSLIEDGEFSIRPFTLPPESRQQLGFSVSGGNPDNSTFVFKARMGDTIQTAVCVVHVTKGPPDLKSGISFETPIDHATDADLSNIVVVVGTENRGGAYGFFGSPVLRFTTPYVSIRRPDGKYGSGSPLRQWRSVETYLPTSRLNSLDPQAAALNDTRTYTLRQRDALDIPSLMGGDYTLSAYDHVPKGLCIGFGFFEDIAAHITVNVTGTGASPRNKALGGLRNGSGGYAQSNGKKRHFASSPTKKAHPLQNIAFFQSTSQGEPR